MPNPAQLPLLPIFQAAPATLSGLDLLAVAAASMSAGSAIPLSGQAGTAAALSLPEPYNPAVALPPKVVKKVLDLEFVEMSELRGDIWMEDTAPTDSMHQTRRPTANPPVTDIRVWLECYARMAALITSHFTQKASELWAYQSTILKAAHNYEGSSWVAYNRQFRRDMLARKDLNWSMSNARLYNEAFTCRAKSIPRCPHYLGDDHMGSNCPLNPSPLVIGWLQESSSNPPQTTPNSLFPRGQTRSGGGKGELCRNFNENRCRFTRCRYQHSCSLCLDLHPAVFCPQNTRVHGMESSIQGRNTARGRPGNFHPYVPHASRATPKP